jgi:hypothetical protein
MKYEDVREFIRASLEYETAVMARRQSLVGPSEVARLGAIAFPTGFEKYRSAIDVIVREAASAACGVQLASNSETVGRALHPESAKAFRTYAASVAGLIVKHETEAAERRANGLRYVEMPADFRPAYDCGVWEPGAIYGKGALTTDHGTLWSCRVDGASDRPGTSGNWRLMVKSEAKTGTRR